MRECPYCKTILEDDELFCHECGTKQEIEESVAPNDKAAPLEKKCIHCGETIEEDSTYCSFCGKLQFVDEKEAEPEPAVEEPRQAKKEKTEGEKPIDDENDESKEVSAQETPEERPHYDWEDEPKSKKWIWILLVVLLIGGGIGLWYYMDDNQFGGRPQAMQEAVDSDSIKMDNEEITPTSPLAFLEQFYKGDYENEEYIKQHVTASVINKLKRDYEYDCPTDDCLATWVFTAYPPGSDLYLEEGPIITKSKEDGKYSVYYSYYTQGQSGNIYKPRGLLVSVSQIDGKYLISDYELVMPDIDQNQNDITENSEGDESQEMSISEDEHTAQASSMQEKQQYSAFFVFGTTRELTEFGILDEGGRLRPNFDKNYFTKIDTRVDKKINLYTKSAKILTPHPTNSYTLMLNENHQYVLTISDPQLFWSSSSYLVILVK